jgi:DNA invertase Pin-like site-specific DNA recombinase
MPFPTVSDTDNPLCDKQILDMTASACYNLDMKTQQSETLRKEEAMSKNQNQVAIYARVSTEDQSLDSQLHDLRGYCKSRGWGDVVEYVDHGISGTKESRPGWNACWDALQKGKVKVLVVAALDRIGRSLPHLVKTVNFFAERGLTLVSYRENIDLSSPSGRMLAGIFSVMAEYERNIISERTKAGMRSARAKGKQIGKFKSYFSTDRAAELRDKGWGQIRIAKELGVGVGRVNAWAKEFDRQKSV